MTIPENVERKLNENVWKRSGQDGLENAFLELGVPKSDDFVEFYCKYWGPFHSKSIGHELLDVIEQDESIVSNTRDVQRDFGLADRYLVVPSLICLSVLVYDVTIGCVYDIDFEGGDELLKAEQLRPRWNSWREFVSEYFS